MVSELLFAQIDCGLQSHSKVECQYHIDTRINIFHQIMNMKCIYISDIEENFKNDSLYYYQYLLYLQNFLHKERRLKSILKSKRLTIQLAEWLRDCLQLNLYVIETYKLKLLKHKIGIEYMIVLQSEFDSKKVKSPFI